MTERAPLPRRPPTMGHQVVGEAPGRRAVTCRGPGRGRGSALLALGVLWAGLGPLPARLADAAVPAVESVASPTPLPVVFSSGSVTFVSLSTGWALGTVPCAGPGRCLALRRTVDGGRTWKARPLPEALLRAVNRTQSGYPVLDSGATGYTVRFADPADGWLLGPAGGARTTLWATHDGGAGWHVVKSLPGLDAGALFDVEAARGTVYALGLSTGGYGTGAAVAASPVGRDAWRAVRAPALGMPAGGAQPTGSIVLQGGAGWLVEGNDRGVTGSARLLPDGNWGAWTAPCRAVGDSYTVPAAAGPTRLFALCQMGGFASSLSPAAPPGAALGSTWLYGSADAGTSFHPVVQLGAGYTASKPAAVIGFGTLAAASARSLVVGRWAPRPGLLASFDGGLHWQVVHQGAISYVGFTSPEQGVAITAPTGPASGGPTGMIMTRDGGRHWAPVHF